MTGHISADWRVALLNELDIGVTPYRVAMLAAWGGSKTMPAWTHNPLCCRLETHGSRTLTAQGIKQYPDYETGIVATALALAYPAMIPTVAALKAQDSAGALYHAIRSSDWPWVDLDRGYPVMLCHLASVATDPDATHAVPVVTDALHGGYPTPGLHSHSRAGKDVMRIAIGNMIGIRNSVTHKLRRGSRHG